jgi:hypothetical protein
MQYLYFANTQKKSVTDPDTGLKVYRGQFDMTAQKRAELIAGGITGLINVGYEIIEANEFVATGRLRWGLRDVAGVDYVVWDAETDATGFAGTEGVNWVNINGAY